VFIVVSVYFVIDSVRKLLDTPSYAYIYACATNIVIVTNMDDDKIGSTTNI